MACITNRVHSQCTLSASTSYFYLEQSLFCLHRKLSLLPVCMLLQPWLQAVPRHDVGAARLPCATTAAATTTATSSVQRYATCQSPMTCLLIIIICLKKFDVSHHEKTRRNATTLCLFTVIHITTNLENNLYRYSAKE